MATKNGWQRTGALLRMTYGKLATPDALNSLYRALDDLDDEALIEATSRHIDDSSAESNGSLAGSWFPKPAQVRVHARSIAAEAAQSRREKLEAEAAAVETASDAGDAVVVDFPLGGNYGSPKQLEVKRSKCSPCRDSGIASYYIPRDRRHPASKYRVFLEPEYLQLPETMRVELSRFSAVCDCEVGELKRRANPAAHQGFQDNGRTRRAYITIEEARKYSAERRRRESRD